MSFLASYLVLTVEHMMIIGPDRIISKSLAPHMPEEEVRWMSVSG
jgi:hypothetical protein